MKKNIWLICLLFSFSYTNASDPVKLIIDCNKETGILRRSELYNNNSLLRTPSSAITNKYKKEIGVTKIMRCWVTIGDYWNYETNEYNYNFKCGWDLNLWDNFHDYMERFSEISEEILLNVRGCHPDVVKGKITMEQWRTACKNGIKHYKERFPKIKYIEALNEYELGDFGGLTNDEYYQFYKEFYKIINEINSELKPEIPLEIGGPCITRGNFLEGITKTQNMRDFLRNYARDTDPEKQLSFISYHEYRFGKNPSLVSGQEAMIKSWCREFGIPDNIPIFITEMGDNSESRRKTIIYKNQLLQAACMSSLFYYYNQQPQVQGFHWVIQHKSQDRKNQIFDNLRWSPYGISLKMHSHMAPAQIEVNSPKIKEGKGVYCVASKGKNKLTVLLWNYQWETGKKSSSVELNIQNLLDVFDKNKLKLKEYLLDSGHNNIHTTRFSVLTVTDDQLLSSKESDLSLSNDALYSVVLEPNAMCLLEISTE